MEDQLRQELVEVFELCSKRNYLTQQQYEEALRYLGLNQPHEAIEKIEKMNLQTFIVKMKERYQEDRQKESPLKAAFKCLKPNQLGRVDLRTLNMNKKMTELSEAETKKVFQTIDKQEKGYFTYQQFATFMQDKPQK